jgi:hypothetical protein
MNIPNKCPSCDGKLIITELCCSNCNTHIKGNFELPELALLNPEEEKFLQVFLASRGSIKEVEKQMGISYPTVRAKLESLVSKLGLTLETEEKKRRSEVIEKLERGEITAQDAIKILKNLE